MKSTFVYMVIWVSICIAAIIGHMFWYIAIANESTVVKSLQNKIDTKTETASRISSVRTALAEITNDESTVLGYFVPETEIVSFIDDLESQARKQTATINVLSVSESNMGKQSTIVLSLTISGTFDAVMRTVGAVEYAPYDLSISKLSLSKGEKNVWRADLELTVGSVAASEATSTQATIQKNDPFFTNHP